MHGRRHGGGLRAAAVSAVAVLAGAVMLAVGLAAQEPAPPQAPTGEAASTSEASPSQEKTPSTRASAPEKATSDASDGGTDRSPAGSTEQGATKDSSAQPLPASEPRSITLPGRDISGDVTPIALADDGTLPAPRGALHDHAAWFDGSPTPGQNGPAVIEGHVTYSGKPSVFFELGSVRSGDEVEVGRADGTTAHFEVYRVVRQAKDEFPTWAVYGNTPDPELRLITCGGDVDSSGRHADNVVVFARLVDGD